MSRCHPVSLSPGGIVTMTPKPIPSVRLRSVPGRPRRNGHMRACSHPSAAKPIRRPSGAMASCHQLAYPAIFESTLVGQRALKKKSEADAENARERPASRSAEGWSRQRASRRERAARAAAKTSAAYAVEVERTARLHWRSRGSVHQPARKAGCEAVRMERRVWGERRLVSPPGQAGVPDVRWPALIWLTR
ncbi:hypothetical protein QFZ88_005579 [Mesorhizobium sp. YL-MeA3-2017]|jgi:hypothetical protein|nr:hypothetical protein [Mesorhizobium sp. YL-MeA3-2017]